MKILKIRKNRGGGGFRTIYVPSRAGKARLKSDLPRLHAQAMTLDVHGVMHGFVPGRSPVTNAKAHVGPWRFTVSWDIKDCFDSISKEMVKAILTKVEERWFPDGFARQGLPTSPVLCNIALAFVDAAIVRFLDGRGVYTRYADDMTVSTSDRQLVDDLLEKTPEIVGGAGFRIADHKTLVQDSRFGRRIITGVGVDDKVVYPTRASKRRERAAKHQNRKHHARGLEEWNKVKPPDVGRVLMRWMNSPDSGLTIASAIMRNHDV